MQNHYFEHIAVRTPTPLILLCDHASAYIPPEYGDLGLSPACLARHIAYDIGTAAVTRALAQALGAPAVLSHFSRLLIDPNRGEDDPTLIMRISDCSPIAGNVHVDGAERARRLNTFYRPYHAAIATQVEETMRAHGTAVIFSLHSFTPVFKGKSRPWQAAVLWDSDERFAMPLLHALEEDTRLLVGNNAPYDGALKGDTLYRHATMRGIPGALVEIRQDLIADENGIAHWGEKLAEILRKTVATKPPACFMPKALPTRAR